MSKVKFARRIEFLVTENVRVEKENIVQTFQFWTNNKKNLKYAYDQRFCLRAKLEKLYKKELLDSVFLYRNESENKVEFIYKPNPEIKNTKTKTINCEFYLPPYNGCIYCTKCKKEGDFLYCTEKKKHYDSAGIKSCPVFQSIDEIIS